MPEQCKYWLWAPSVDKFCPVTSLYICTNGQSKLAPSSSICTSYSKVSDSSTGVTETLAVLLSQYRRVTGIRFQRQIGSGSILECCAPCTPHERLVPPGSSSGEEHPMYEMRSKFINVDKT